ncbi:MAG: hypothetical protein Q9208_001880 [Pyrenodesmia sp. 3 TL-2023]
MAATIPSHAPTFSSTDSTPTPTATTRKYRQTRAVNTSSGSATDPGAEFSSSAGSTCDSDDSISNASESTTTSTSSTEEEDGKGMSVSRVESPKSQSGSQHAKKKTNEKVEAAKEQKEELTVFEGLGERDDVPKGKRRNLLEARVKKIRSAK